MTSEADSPLGKHRRTEGSAAMNHTTILGISRTAMAVLSIAAVLAFAGCRRTDVRDFEVAIPALSSEAEPAIRQSLAKFGGIDKPSIRLDQKSKRLTLRYDSMQLAKKNIEMAIAKVGFEANGVTPESVGAKRK